MKAEVILVDFANALRRFDEALGVYERLQEFRQPFQDLHRRLCSAHKDAF